ncbi:PSD1 and planctomycete cytochrome C domain-containing protein [Stieleria maiorica]|nr:PSD1 and planctomycete cytochrome C domain-containing protein [Stieleria maiorica]
MMRFLVIVIVIVFLGIALGQSDAADNPVDWSGDWTRSRSGGVSQWFEIHGTGGRNNPLRRQLNSPFDGDQLYVRFELRYDASSIDTPKNGNGEFLVLWLDEQDGGDTAGHNGGVPNIGLHVDGDANAFMARYTSSSQHFSDIQLQGDRVYTVLAKIARSQSGSGQPYDRLSVWIDPEITDAESPAITVASNKAIQSIRWIGFATGMKTEPDDRISVSDLSLATGWAEAFGLPAPTAPVAKPPPSPVPTATATVSFSKDVFPVLRQRCFQCHSGEDPESGLRLDCYDDLLNQLSPRDADASHLIALVESSDPTEQMPPPDDDSGRLTSDEIRVLRTWIDEGVSWDHQLLPTPTLDSDHWAFEDPRRPPIPTGIAADRLRTPVDAFIAQNQRELGTTPADTASWPTLQQRIALDLTGLPASAFPGLEQATSHEALDRWIDQLLCSPAYAQRWGRHWLDLARWAESNGHQHNRPRPHAWRYRDYVIESFQNDKPYDQFIREQIAGDELPADSRCLEATGFLAAARYSGNELDKEIQRHDILVDVVNTTAKTFLGITLECAQCHTHKFDPLTIRDYYRLQAFFTSGQPGNLLLGGAPDQASSWINTRWQLFDSVHTRLVDRKRSAGVPEPVLVIPKSVVAGMNAQERKAFKALDAAIASIPQVWGWSDADSGAIVAPHEMRWPLTRDLESVADWTTYLRLRGDPKSAGPEVRAGWPAVFGPTPDHVDSRTDLADWIASPDNPLTARVWVNRIWQWHFGTGLVATSGDFGTQGTAPTHPELLDWLADELVASGWSTRHIHRLILGSKTYRQSAAISPSNQEADPECHSLWRWIPRRLESEAIRDCVLSVADSLDETSGGPSVREGLSNPSHRRSVYLQQERDRIAESLTLFDSPAAVATCSRRRVSTVSLQSLYLMNSDFMQSMSQCFAERVRNTAANDEHAAVAFRLATGRQPTGEEEDRMRHYLRDHSLESLCLVIFNLSEFLYVN